MGTSIAIPMTPQTGSAPQAPQAGLAGRQQPIAGRHGTPERAAVAIPWGAAGVTTLPLGPLPSSRDR